MFFAIRVGCVFSEVKSKLKEAEILAFQKAWLPNFAPQQIATNQSSDSNVQKCLAEWIQTVDSSLSLDSKTGKNLIQITKPFFPQSAFTFSYNSLKYFWVCQQLVVLRQELVWCFFL
jgi:hypothetical protein